MPETPGPRPRLGDHARVAWLLVLSLGGVIPYLLFLPLSPFLTPWLRARTRRRLGAPPTPPADPPPTPPQGGTVFVVAGEASGDELAARVIRRLKERDPSVRVRGYGGPACRAAGAELDEEIAQRAVMGFFPVVASLGFWWGLCARTLARFRETPPDLLLTVDFPGLNVRLAGWARARGIRTVHLVAPQIWAHTPWRILRWRRAVDVLLASFPYEPALFEQAGLHTVYVGHALFESPLPAPRTQESPPAGPAVVELWPGSRRREIERHAPLLVEAAAEVERSRAELVFVVRLARPEHEAIFRRAALRGRWSPRELAFVVGEPELPAPLLGAIASSGTATAQLAVGLVPLTVFYRIGFIDWCFAQLIVTAPFIALANLVLGRRAITERLCWAPDNGERIAQEFLAAAGTAAAWRATRADLAEVRRRLENEHVALRAAGWVLAELASTRRLQA